MLIRGTIEITTTAPCSLACIYCPQSLMMKNYRKQSDKHMSLETFKKCLSTIPKDISITFSGYAECFLNPLCPEMIKYANDEGYELYLYTTLTGFKKEWIPTLKNIPLKTKHLHLPDMEGQMRGAKVDDNYIENAIAFKNEIGYTGAICYGTLHPKLWSIFPDTQQHPNKGLHSRAENISKEKMADIQHFEPKKGKIGCGVANRHNMDVIRINVLLPNGDVQLCCMDYGLKHKLGNLLVDNYDNLFNSAEYKKLECGLDNDSLDILCRTCKEAVHI